MAQRLAETDDEYRARRRREEQLRRDRRGDHVNALSRASYARAGSERQRAPDQKESTMSNTTLSKRHAGEVRRFDFQSDIYRRRYRLVEDLGGGRWLVEILEIEDAVLAVMEDDAQSGTYYPTQQDILDEIDETGTTREVRFVSNAQWNWPF
jgi:hypothetical protein